MRFGWRDSVSELRVHCCSDSGHSVTWCKTDQPSEPTKNGAEREGPNSPRGCYDSGHAGHSMEARH